VRGVVASHIRRQCMELIERSSLRFTSSLLLDIVNLQMEIQRNQPKAQYPLSQGLRLDTIAEDVQHIIAAELNILSPPSILAMAQSSQSLRQVALPLLYQDVVLHRENDEASTPQAYEALVGLFRGGGEGSIARHVRHLVIKDELPTDDLMMIFDTISEFGILRKLR
jgi:hypothetical protein